MNRPQEASVLRAAHQQLMRERTLDLTLSSSERLLTGNGSERSGVDVATGILRSALRLPDSTVVRVTLPPRANLDEADVAAFRRHCRGQADAAWRDAMAIRQGGFRELPRALALAALVAVVGAASGYVAQVTESTVLMVILYTTAFLAMIAAWTIGWTPTEQAAFDWRASAHEADLYQRLADARIEVVTPAPESDQELHV